MEELQSTEILDQEILEDARKKAQRILKTADDTIKTKSADSEKNLNAALDELEKKYQQQGKRAADEIRARLPIDKRRIKAKKIDALLNAAVESWYAGLSRSNVLDLLKKELAKRLAASDKAVIADSIRAQIHQVEPREAEAILQAVLPGKPVVIEPIHTASPYPEIILDTREARIYASISKIVELLLDEQRAELVEALLGNTVLSGQAEAAGDAW